MTEVTDANKHNLPILLVDDEPAIRLYHRVTLERYFANILVAEDGRQAWEIYSQHPEIPLVITDVDMPRMHGLELVAKILADDPCTQIVIVSGLIENEISFHSVRQNIAYLPKPVDRTFLCLAALRGYNCYPEAVWYERFKGVASKKPRDIEKIMTTLEQAPWLTR